METYYQRKRREREEEEIKKVLGLDKDGEKEEDEE